MLIRKVHCQLNEAHGEDPSVFFLSRARGTYLHCLFCLWQWRAHYLRVWRAVSEARRDSIRQWRATIIRRLSDAHVARRTRAVVIRVLLRLLALAAEQAFLPAAAQVL